METNEPTEQDPTPVTTHEPPFTQVQPSTDVPVETRITYDELSTRGLETEEDQLDPHEVYAQYHPTPNRPSGRLP